MKQKAVDILRKAGFVVGRDIIHNSGYKKLKITIHNDLHVEVIDYGTAVQIQEKEYNITIHHTGWISIDLF